MRGACELQPARTVAPAPRHEVSLPPLDAEKRPLRRENVAEGVFLVHEALSQAECERLIAATEAIGYKSLSDEFDPEERNNERVMVMDGAMADALWKRLSQVWTADDALFLKPVGFQEDSSVWHPTTINACLKFSKYSSQGQKFEAHRDGPWVPLEDQASIFTVLAYLSHVPEECGGQTILYADDGTESARIAPKQGTILFFLHDICHAGAPLVNGSHPKYVLRSELIFRRINSGDVPPAMRLDYQKLPEYQKMVQLYVESLEAYAKGNVEGFTKKYEQVSEIQRHASMRPLEAKAFGRGNLPLPSDVMVLIMAKLDLRTLLRCSTLSKTMRKLYGSHSHLRLLLVSLSRLAGVWTTAFGSRSTTNISCGSTQIRKFLFLVAT